MSDYLVRGIEEADNVRVRTAARLTGGGGEGQLEHLTIEDPSTGHAETVPADALFVLIGAEPRTEWLPGEITRDERGFAAIQQVHEHLSRAPEGDGAQPRDRRSAPDPYADPARSPAVIRGR